jgi:hypothetical protein
MAITLNGTTGITTPAIDNQGNLTVDGGTIKLDGNYPVGTGNVALGDTALDSNVSGASNVAIGADALTANTASNNTAVGYQAGYSSTVNGSNTFIGGIAGYNNTTGSENLFVGYGAGYNSSTGSFNTYVGRGQAKAAGSEMTTGSRNTILGGYTGNQGGLDLRTSSNNIVLSDGDGNPWGYYNHYGGVTSLWVFKAFSSGQNVMQIHNTATSNPYGPAIVSTAAAPNNTSIYSLETGDYLGVRMRVWSNGNIVNVNNSYGAYSDVKLKENIIDASSQWDDIKNLTVRKYSLKADNLDAPNMLGVIAQEVEAAGMGGLVYESPDRDADKNDLGTVTKQVNYSILYMKAVKALQEAMTRIETLEAKVTALEGN